MPHSIDLLLHGGDLGAFFFVIYVGYKVNNRLNRDESLRRDYPPHRHINGSVIYPSEYEPAQVDHLTVKSSR